MLNNDNLSTRADKVYIAAACAEINGTNASHFPTLLKYIKPTPK
jgi:hypothetical protein